MAKFEAIFPIKTKRPDVALMVACMNKSAVLLFFDPMVTSPLVFIVTPPAYPMRMPVALVAEEARTAVPAPLATFTVLPA